VPTMARAISLNIAMLVTYETAKEQLTARYGNGHPKLIMFAGSMMSAVMTSTCSLPFDNLKTKL